MPPEPATTVEKTPEQIAAEQQAAEDAKKAPQDVINEMFAPVVTPPKKKPDEKPAPAKPAAKPAAKPTPKPKPAPAKPEPAAPIDAETLAEAVGRGVAAAMVKAEPEKPAVVTVETEGLSEDEIRQLPVLEKMEALFPDRYKNLKARYMENARAVKKYRDKWEEEHPGQDFDPESNEHDGFFAKHSVDWEDDDAVEARAEMRLDKRLPELTRQTQSELEQLRAKERAREAEPAIVAQSLAADRLVFDLVGGEFKNLLKPDNTLNTDVLKKIETEDPVAYEIIFPEVMRIRQHCQEILRLDRNVTALNPKNPMHAFILDWAARQEKEFLALPRDKQLDKQGRKFTTSLEFSKMTEAQRAKHWTLRAPELNKLFAAEYGTAAIKRLESERARVQRLASQLGYVKADKTKSAASQPAAKPGASEPESEPEEINSPTTTSARIPAPDAGGKGGGGQKPHGGFFEDF
jgi:hypothetical protein